jgi:NitT/TauT family transport system permease protein
MTLPRTSANIEIPDASWPGLSPPDSTRSPSTPGEVKVAADRDNPPIKSLNDDDDAQRSRFTKVNIKPARRLPVQKDWPTSAIVAVQTGILVAIIAGWEIGAETGFIDQFFWSSPSAIYHTLTIFFTTGDAFTDIAFTFRSTILGFLIGTFAGSALGLSFWWSRNYAAIMQPYIICFESLPKLALAPLIVLVFGIGIASKIAIAAALTLIVSTLTTFAGVKAVDPDGEKLFYSLGATRLQVFRKLVIPSCLPWIISVLRVNIGLALTGAIVGEFIASQHGLGRAIIYAGQTYDIALVWVAVSVLSTLAVVMYVTVSWIERLLQRGITG